MAIQALAVRYPPTPLLNTFTSHVAKARTPNGCSTPWTNLPPSP
jgi:hypothetical protein